MTVGGSQVHSVRLPSFVVSTEIVFARPGERLTIRHDAGGTAEPYVEGTLLAVRRVPDLVGLTQGSTPSCWPAGRASTASGCLSDGYRCS